MGIFDEESSLFTKYRATLEFRDKLMGGVPMDAKMIEGWLRSKAGISDEQEVMAATVRTLRELGAEIPDEASYEQIVAASDQLAAELHTNGFKRNGHGLYVEGRQVKAMIKENVSVLLTGQTLNLYKNAKGEDKGKAARSAVAERVHVAEQQILLDRAEPDGVDLFIGHTNGPKGPQSNLTYFQYAEQPRLSFTVRVVEPCLSDKQWQDVWVLAQENGLGALRSQSFGRFDIVEWQKL